MPTSYNFADAQQLLLKPFERLRFVIIFVLTTSVSVLIANFVCSQPAFTVLWERNQIQYGITTGIISGMFIGAAQWLTLRKYVSDWKWILVVVLSNAFVASIRTASDMHTKSFFLSIQRLSRQEIFMNILVAACLIILMIVSLFIYGYLQWYVLRSYVTKARWWIFIPFIAVLPGMILFFLSFLTRGSFQFNISVLSMTMLPTTQAIGFCILKKKSVSENPGLQSPLSLAPDIVNYWDIKRLERILYTSINRIWDTDLITPIIRLKYLVGVNFNGTMITYEPMNQASDDNVGQTPLPELANAPSCAGLEAELLTSFAKFQVVFTPPSMVQIDSWRGMPLIWLGVAVYAGIIGISVLSARSDACTEYSTRVMNSWFLFQSCR